MQSQLLICPVIIWDMVLRGWFLDLDFLFEFSFSMKFIFKELMMIMQTRGSKTPSEGQSLVAIYTYSNPPDNICFYVISNVLKF